MDLSPNFSSFHHMASFISFSLIAYFEADTKHNILLLVNTFSMFSKKKQTTIPLSHLKQFLNVITYLCSHIPSYFIE